MLIDNLALMIEKLLPPETAMNGDKVGIQIKGAEVTVKNILVTLEVTDEVITEAVEMSADTIITFHPLIFSPLSIISFDERVGRLVSKLIQAGINLISVHTTFDAFENGTSKLIAEKLNLKNIEFLVQDKIHNNCGMGIIADCRETISTEEFLANVSRITKSPLRYNIITKPIYKIAILGGSGSSFIDEALLSEADAFITADVSYHKFHYVSGKMMIIDPGHYEMEQFVAGGIKRLLEEYLNDKSVKIYESKVLTNPVRYYPNPEKYEQEQNNLLINK